MHDVEQPTVDAVDAVTADAVREIQAAWSSTDLRDELSTPAAPDEQPAAAVAGVAAVGHGPIRLRGQSPRPSEAHATTTPPRDAAAAAGPIGHGTIRLRSATVPADAAVAEPLAAPEPAGHGPVRLAGRKALAEPELAEPDEPATVAAREAILAALAVTE